MLEIWIKELRKHINLSEPAAAKHLKRVVSWIDGAPPFSIIAPDSGDLQSVIWWKAWTQAVIVGAYLSAECSYYAYGNRGQVMTLSQMTNPFMIHGNLIEDVKRWYDEISKHKPMASQNWEAICRGLNSNSYIGNHMVINFDWSELFSIPDLFNTDAEKISVKPDQVWQHQKFKDVTAQVLKILDDDSIEVIIVGRDAGATHSWQLGKIFVIPSSGAFADNWSLFKDIESGEICNKCGKEFPYANKSKKFICYSCRNGLL